MPEIFRMYGIPFFFYSNDHKPVHIHVEKADGEARFTIRDNDLELVISHGMKRKI